MSRFQHWFALCLAIIVAAPLGPVTALQVAQAQTADPEHIRQMNVPNTDDVKFPDVLGVNNLVYVSGSPGSTSNRRATYVTLNEPYAGDFSSRVDLGDADGGSDFSPTVSAVGADGTVYMEWIRAARGDRGVYLRRKGPGDSGFGETRTIVSGDCGTCFRSRPEVAVLTTGRVFAVWDEDSRHRYRFSDDGGANWSGTARVSNDTVASRPSWAAGPDGALWAIFSTGGDAEPGEIKVARWNGNSFDAPVNLTGDVSGYAADPTGTVAPNGNVYVAWRTVGGGIWYAERNATTGAWNKSRLTSSQDSYGTVAIVSDREGNLHMAWGGDSGGNTDTWYAYKALNQNWKGPIRLNQDGDLDANHSISSTLTNFTYGHIVNERFTSAGLATRYNAMRVQASGCSGTLTLTGEFANGTITAKDPVAGVVARQDEACSTMQISLGTPPTGKDTPARVAFTPNISVDIPDNLVGQQCAFTVYGQLYKNDTAFNAQSAFSASIIVDPPGDVDAVVRTLNPNISGLSATYTPFAGDNAAAAGASNGDPAWTRTLSTLLKINNNGDCSGLNAFTLGTTQGTVGGAYSNVLALPYPANEPPGPKAVNVTVTDQVGNTRVFSSTLNYDPLDDPSNQVADESGRPVVNSATLSGDDASAAARKSILRTLTFTNTNVTDSRYRHPNGAQFWGIWVATGPRNNLSPDPDTLLWVPVEAKNPGQSFSVPWNLLNNGNGARLDQDGKYVIFAKFLDGAGNPSTATFSTTLTLDPGYSLPTQWLPLVRKP